MARTLQEAAGLTAEETLATTTITTLGPTTQIEERVATQTPEWSTPTTPPENLVTNMVSISSGLMRL